MICSFNKVAKMFGGHSVFEQLMLEIKQGDRLGIIGRNGSGKTTIFKLISGVDSPDEGEIHIKRGTSCSYLSQVPDYGDDLTVYAVLRTAFNKLTVLQQQIQIVEQELSSLKNDKELGYKLETYGKMQEQFQRDGGYQIEAKIERVSHGLGLNEMHDQLFSSLSGGEKTKVGLGLMLLQEADLLLLDEPTNHLDIDAVEWLESYLKPYDGTVVIISHDRYFLDEVITKIIDIEDGEAHVYHGNYTYFAKEKEERLLAEFAKYQEQEKKIKKMKETIKRLKEWANQANPPNAGLHKRAKSMEKALEKIEKMKRPMIDQRKMALDFSMNVRSGQDVASLERITYGYRSIDPLFKDTSMTVRFKERVALVGKNGTGKSTLLKMISGDIKPIIGSVQIGSQVHIGYLSQQDFAGDKQQTVLDSFRGAVPIVEGDARHILAKFLFYGYEVFKRIANLSGGERMRLRLAQLMYQKINLLILDEPTNHLDIDSREVLEDAIEQFDGTIIVVSHDRYLLNKCFPTTYWLFNQRLVKFHGNYSEAKVKKEEIFSMQGVQKDSVESHKTGLLQASSKSMQQELSLQEIEEEIEKYEKTLISIEEAMMSNKAFEELLELQLRKEDIEQQRERLYDKLNDRLGGF